MSHRPRLALVTSGFGPTLGGVGVVSAGIAGALAADAKITVWRHRPDWPPRLRAVALLLRALVAAVNPPDAILFTHVDLARLMAVSPWLRGIPYGVLIYGVEVWRPLDRSRRVALERAGAIFAISQYTVRKARESNPWLPEPRIVWLGAPDGSSRERRETKPIALVLGRMAAAERYKGHDALIDAWPRVVQTAPHAQLVIVGDGDDRARLEARAAGQPSIVFTGFLSDARRQELLDSAAMLVSISTGEGFGLAAVEAASCGVPVVALKGTVTEELFPGGSGHVLLESTAPAPLAEALVALLTDADRARAIGAAGRQRVRDAFTTDHFNQRLRAAITPLAAAR